MSQDERSLFGDEQAYIASRQHLAELERERKRKELLALKKRFRRPGRSKSYTSSGLALMHRFWQKQYLRRVMADPERHAALKEQNRKRTAKSRALHPGRANEISRASYQRNREAVRMAQALYYREHHDEILAHRRAMRAAKKAARQQQDQSPDAS